jgi:transposase
LIADRTYDSDPICESLKKRGIEMIVPYQKNGICLRHEDGHKLRRHKNRWIIGRTNAWFGQFRRLIVPYKHLLSTFRLSFISTAAELLSAGIHETRSRRMMAYYCIFKV